MRISKGQASMLKTNSKRAIWLIRSHFEIFRHEISMDLQIFFSQLRTPGAQSFAFATFLLDTIWLKAVSTLLLCWISLKIIQFGSLAELLAGARSITLGLVAAWVASCFLRTLYKHTSYFYPTDSIYPFYVTSLLNRWEKLGLYICLNPVAAASFLNTKYEDRPTLLKCVTSADFAFAQRKFINYIRFRNKFDSLKFGRPCSPWVLATYVDLFPQQNPVAVINFASRTSNIPPTHGQLEDCIHKISSII